MTMSSGGPDRKVLHEQVAGAVAQEQVDDKTAERTANRGEESPESRARKKKMKERPDLDAANAQPPRIIKGVVLFQACCKCKRFLRQIGPNGREEQPDLAPPSPQLAL